MTSITALMEIVIISNSPPGVKSELHTSDFSHPETTRMVIDIIGNCRQTMSLGGVNSL